MIDEPAILRAIRQGYALDFHGDHGVSHWARVFTNGLRLAETTHADPDVLVLFALFHDSRRWNEYDDPGHGPRGAELARSLRGELFELDDTRFELLCEACRVHTQDVWLGDTTLLTCLAADRLDLSRFGITFDPDRVPLVIAPDVVEWAEARAVKKCEPSEVFQRWNVEPRSS